ncbi:MAG: hypothetical protein LBL93_05915 [Ruminococcus sp.]|jgi:diacylglycerol kinase family enzyme|nr:hypothetical protein [Ruminococcus sp.]
MLHLFVINPRSFPDKNVMGDLMVTITKYFGEIAEIYISKYPRDAIAVVNNYLEKATANEETVRVYAVGGDGILFDCLNGMTKYKDHELTSVPYGNANDFLRAFGDENVAKFRDVKYLSKAPTLLTDTFNCGEKTSIVTASIGLECSSVLETEKMVQKISKVPFMRKFVPTLYLLGAVIVLSNKKLRSQYYDITVDGKDYSGEYININIGNSCANGGNHIPNPYAVPNDGWLDAVFIRKMPLIKCFLVLKKYIKGEFEKYPKNFFHVRFKELTVTSDDPVRIGADGESFYASSVKIKINPGSLKFAAPSELEYHPRKKYIAEDSK